MAYVPSARGTDTDRFVDDDGSVFEDDIEWLGATGRGPSDGARGGSETSPADRSALVGR